MKKDLRIETMRIIACLMVILTHVSASVYSSYKIGSLKWHIFNIYDSASMAAVPIFIMISGILLLDPKKNLSIKKIFSKYIPKMIIILITCSIIYSLWYNFVILHSELSLKLLIKDMTKGPYFLWYISIILFLYIESPILREVTKNDNSLLPKYCFWIFLISSVFISINFCSFLPHYKIIKNIIDKIYFDRILYWNSYYLLGYYIYKTDYLDKYKKLSYVLGLIGLVLCITLTAFISIKTNNNNFDFYDRVGFPVFSMSLASIFFMKGLKTRDKKRSIIESISSTTLGIYLIHMIILTFITDVLKYDLKASQIIITIPLMTISVFLISFFIVFIYKKVINIFNNKKSMRYL